MVSPSRQPFDAEAVRRKERDVRAWFLRALVDHEMLLPEVADYELRRELLRLDSKRSIHRLDELTREIVISAPHRRLGRRRVHGKILP